MKKPESNGVDGQALAKSGRDALVYGAAFTIFRDVLQFGTMLVLVRLLSPSEYGQMTFAQAIIGVLSIGTFKAFLSHALQLSDPNAVDWQSHFSAGLILNSIFFLLTLVVAGALALTDTYRDAAVAVAVLSFVFLVEVPASLRHTMVQVAHDWRRFRILTIAGAILGSVTALVIAFMGGGVLALTAPVILFGIPAVIDLFFISKWRPDFSFAWSRYRNTVRFGMTRIGSGGPIAIKNATENATLAASFDFAVLGVFSRSVGLATLAAGRIGSVTVASLFPVITRASAGSHRFRRIASLVLRAVVWVTILIATLVWLVADSLVLIVYGSGWLAVAELLPLAVVYVSVNGITAAAASLLLANQQAGSTMRIDIFFSVLALPLILIAIPMGVKIYLSAVIGLAVTSMFVTFWNLIKSNGIDLLALARAFIPPICAAVAASLALLGSRQLLTADIGNAPRFIVECGVFGLVSIATIRIFFKRVLSETLTVAPAGERIARLLLIDNSNRR
jgi:O-antigen/teichoic acid export membrane protein